MCLREWRQHSGGVNINGTGSALGLYITRQYNAAAESGDGQKKCLGISFSTDTPNCYLKYAIPGDGADRCEVVEHEYRVDSAVLEDGSSGV